MTIIEIATGKREGGSRSPTGEYPSPAQGHGAVPTSSLLSSTFWSVSVTRVIVTARRDSRQRYLLSWDLLVDSNAALCRSLVELNGICYSNMAPGNSFISFNKIPVLLFLFLSRSWAKKNPYDFLSQSWYICRSSRKKKGREKKKEKGKIISKTSVT